MKSLLKHNTRKAIFQPFLIIIYLFSLPFFCFSQVDSTDYKTWENLYEQANASLPNSEKTIEFAKKSEVFALEKFGATSMEYAKSLDMHGAGLYYGQKLNESEVIYQKALKVLEEHFDDSVLLKSDIFGSLASIYTAQRNFVKALPLSRKSLELLKKNKAEKSKAYFVQLSGLASIYDKLGYLQEALNYHLKALKLAEELVGKDQIGYWIRLQSIGNFYLGRKKDGATALQYFEELDTLMEKEHPAYRVVLEGKANSFLLLKKYEKALTLFQTALKLNPPNSFNYAAMVFEIGKCQFYLGNTTEAFQKMAKTLSITEELFGKKHKIYTLYLEFMLEAYENSDKMEENYAIAEDLIEGRLFQIHNELGFLSETEQAHQLEVYLANLAIYQSFFLRHPSAPFTDRGYDLALLTKGTFLENKTRLLAGLNKAEDVALKQQFEEWNELKKSINALYTQPIEKREKQLAELEKQANELENKLVNASQDLLEPWRNIGWKEVKNSLQDDEISIEFVKFRYRDNFDFTDSTVYVAHILKADFDQPKTVFLFEERELFGQKNPQKPSVTQINQWYSGQNNATIAENVVTRGNFKIEPTAANEVNFYAKCWQPLEQYLAGVKTIYYSSTGKLHRLNMGAIPINETEILSDQYQLIQLGSTRQLVTKKEESAAFFNDFAMAFGGILYDVDSLALAKANKPLATSNSEETLAYTSPNRGVSSGSSNWAYLKGTEKEVEALTRIFQKNNLNSDLKTGYAASEDAFKQLGTLEKSPRIIHLATHGFAFPKPDLNDLKPEQVNFATIKNPLARTGLVLAGGNRAWAGKMPVAGYEDGILTAYEISQMNLQNTELVVLSACETGLGDIEGSEGVYGLQRAFKMAGVKYLIMSLWQVPDAQTQELMTAFYTNWLTEKMPIQVAFKAAQKEMQERYEEAYFWAGFVLVE